MPRRRRWPLVFNDDIPYLSAFIVVSRGKTRQRPSGARVASFGAMDGRAGGVGAGSHVLTSAARVCGGGGGALLP